MRTVIRGGRVVGGEVGGVADVAIEGERIVSVGAGAAPGEFEVDARGKLVIPGGIDPHTHMELPVGEIESSDDFYTGTVAAAFGGTTTIIDFATQNRGETLSAGLEKWHRKAAGKCAIDYGFHLCVTKFERNDLSEMRQIFESGVTTFKVFLAYPSRLLIDDATMYRVMRAVGEMGGMTLVHAESGGVIEESIEDLAREGKLSAKWHAVSRPAVTEADGTARALRIAEAAGGPVFIVHVSCGEAMEELARAKARGQRAWGETCTQYLFLDESEYEREGFEAAKYVFTPPLRAKKNMEELWEGLRRGDLVEVATDHCPFNFAGEKELGREDFRKIPNGGPGVEDRLAMVYHGAVVERGFSLRRFVEITSEASARMFGLWPRKGAIRVGSDADIVVFDPEKEQVRSAATHHMRVDYNLYEGRRIKGVVEKVFLRGKLIVDGERYLGRAGDGVFLKRGGCGG